MKFTSSNRLLRSAEPEALGGNGPSNVIPLPAATAATEAPPAAATEPPSGGKSEATPPTLLEQIRGSIQSKGALIADRDAALARAGLAERELLSTKAALAIATDELQTLRAERAEIAAALVTAAAEKQTVDAAAASQVAALGFDPAALPGANSEAEETKEQLVARLEKEPDNDKRYALAAKINAMD